MTDPADQTGVPIDLGFVGDTAPVAAPISATRSLILIVGACAAAVVLALLIALAALSKVPQPHAAPTTTPVRTHSVALDATGQIVYYGLSGRTSRRGSPPAELVDVPAGTHVVVIGIATQAGAEATCSITVDGQLLNGENGYGDGAVAECDLTIR